VSHNDDISRRDFLVRTGAAGLGLTVLGPGVARALPIPTGISGHHVASAADGLAPLFSGLRWRTLGPFRGGRVDAVCGVVGRPNEFYFGHVNGGVWKSIDAGRVWVPIFDSQPVASIGALAVAPSAPDTIYVGSGESTLRDSVGYGNGVYKSTNAGKTWMHLGLDDTQHIGKIAVDPRNPNIVFVAAIGHLYAPNADRGVFKSVDGGKSWRKVLFKNNDVGAVDVVIDPANSRVVYACLWNTRRPPWYSFGSEVPATAPAIKLALPPSNPKSAAHSCPLESMTAPPPHFTRTACCVWAAAGTPIKTIKDNSPSNFLTKPPRVWPIHF